jgi:hypothetical protein
MEKAWTRNWTRKVDRNLGDFAKGLKDQPLQMIEIGVWEARSSLWFLKYLLCHPESHLTCIDPWDIMFLSRRKFPNTPEGRERSRNIELLAKHNLSFYPKKVTIYKDTSTNVLCSGVFKEHSIDVVYVDGVHFAYEALLDLLLMWPIVKVGGYIYIDDYTSRHCSPVIQAVDTFIDLMKGQLEIKFKNNQVLLQKTGETLGVLNNIKYKAGR